MAIINEADKHIVGELEKTGVRLEKVRESINKVIFGQEEVIALARERKTAGHFILGGAVVTRSFAESLGAAYARDGVEAVKVITGLTTRK